MDESESFEIYPAYHVKENGTGQSSAWVHEKSYGQLARLRCCEAKSRQCMTELGLQ